MGPDQRFFRLKVLVVDDNRVCLNILKTMLQQCNYIVTACDRAEDALAYLSEKNSDYDLVLSDELLEAINRLEKGLPVIMMSEDGEVDFVKEGVSHGACDYLIKPVTLNDLRLIWHVFRRRGVKEDQSGNETARGSPALCEGDSLSKKGRGKQLLDERLEDVNGLKKARVVWSDELHAQFVKAVNQLGIGKAVPKRILEIMNVEGLSRDNVASHLQKYRQNLRRLSGVSTQPHPVASFQAAQVGGFAGSMQIQPGGRGVASRGNVMNVPSPPNTTFSDLRMDNDDQNYWMKLYVSTLDGNSVEPLGDTDKR